MAYESESESESESSSSSSLGFEVCMPCPLPSRPDKEAGDAIASRVDGWVARPPHMSWPCVSVAMEWVLGGPHLL